MPVDPGYQSWRQQKQIVRLEQASRMIFGPTLAEIKALPETPHPLGDDESWPRP